MFTQAIDFKVCCCSETFRFTENIDLLRKTANLHKKLFRLLSVCKFNMENDLRKCFDIKQSKQGSFNESVNL